MVVKDFRCVKCHTTQEQVCEGEIEEMILHCKCCSELSQHLSCCNGGINSRYRFADWGGCDFGDDIKFDGAIADYENGDPATDRNGRQFTYKDQDKISAKRDEINHRQARKFGKTPIVVDQGRKNAS